MDGKIYKSKKTIIRYFRKLAKHSDVIFTNDDENELSEAIDNLVYGIIRELRKELNNGDQKSI